MTSILIPYDYPCGKEVSDNVYCGKVPELANGSSQNNGGSFLIHCQALGRPAWNSHSEEQGWHPSLMSYFWVPHLIRRQPNRVFRMVLGWGSAARGSRVSRGSVWQSKDMSSCWIQAQSGALRDLFTSIFDPFQTLWELSLFLFYFANKQSTTVWLQYGFIISIWLRSIHENVWQLFKKIFIAHCSLLGEGQSPETNICVFVEISSSGELHIIGFIMTWWMPRIRWGFVGR